MSNVLSAFWDYVFSGPESLLNQAIAYMSHLSTIAAAGINLSMYVSWMGVLDPAWQGVMNSFLASVALIATLFVVRSVYRAYLSVKNGIQWW